MAPLRKRQMNHLFLTDMLGGWTEIVYKWRLYIREAYQIFYHWMSSFNILLIIWVCFLEDSSLWIQGEIASNFTTLFLPVHHRTHTPTTRKIHTHNTLKTKLCQKLNYIVVSKLITPLPTTTWHSASALNKAPATRHQPRLMHVLGIRTVTLE